MNKTQLASLRQSAELVAANAEVASARFYDGLFERNPELKALFSSEMGGQGKRLMQMIDTVVFALDQPAMLGSLLRQLGQRHAGYGVLPEHYPLVGQALIGALAATLGERFTPDVRAAWEAFFELASTTMMEGAREPVDMAPWKRQRA
jgi:hemoglobin-like flavoprotein